MGPPVWLFKVALFYLKCKAGKNAASPSRERFHKKVGSFIRFTSTFVAAFYRKTLVNLNIFCVKTC